MTRRTTSHQETPPFPERFGVSPDDLAEIFGDDFLSLTHDEALNRLHDTLARLVAEADQAQALLTDIGDFTTEFLYAIATHGTTHLGELCDTVTTNLGRHTTGTTFAHVAIAGLLEADAPKKR